LPPFTEYCLQVQRYLEEVHGLAVITRDIPDPLTGDLDGASLHVDHLLAPEQRLFLLAHLFGHTAQWNLSDRGYELGRPQQPPVEPALLQELLDYEHEAAGYALAMLHRAGVVDLDQWFSSYAACDAAYLRHYHVTGEKREFLTFWRDSAPLIAPRDAPPFVPTRRPPRTDGIVI